MANKEELRKQFTKEWEKHYKIEFLVKKGFQRKQCKKCGRYFWSLDSNRNVCADSTCARYDFIGKGTTNMGYVETWREIEKYFTKKGHVSIPRYPTVCRWRDDLYFTNASIIDFQPYVVSGEIEPPGNPLIVPQASLRFGDIENVGVTGQHYSSFIMFGQHAFNSQKTGLFYWKNEALEHDFTYVTKILGIKPEKLCFQEEVWAGGGTFGPCIEYCADGVELGNCVFMQFKELPGGKYEELKTKVIDMGAGLERLAWFTNGTPTSYDITFEQVLKKMLKYAGLKIDRKLFERYAKLSGALDADGADLKKEWEILAKKLEYDKKELMNTIRPVQAIYAIADHLKTILYATTDGMLPSNSGGGYNLRILLRRCFGFNEEFSLNMNLPEILFEHAEALKDFDYTLKEGVPTAAAVVGEEFKKYKSTTERGSVLVSTLLDKAKKGEKISNEKMVELYESHGIPMEFIAEQAKKKNIDLEIPANFYGMLAKKNEKTIEKISREIDVSKFKKTEELFYIDRYLQEFDAKVLGIIDNAIILDKTLFYAESGGQESDTGFLNDIKVEEVQKKEGIFLHYVENTRKFKVGQTVIGKINWERRHALMKHHTATHLLNAACREVLGKHTWQAGAHKKENESHLDITHYKHITDEEMRTIELLVNRWIQANYEVKMFSLMRNEAEAKYGFRLYQGGYVPGKVLKIVEIPTVDVEACGGTHVSRTGELGFFKILKKESIQDGVERITFATGLAALAKINEQEDLLTKAAENLSVPKQDLAKATERFFKEWKEQKKIIEKTQESNSKSKIDELANSKEKIIKKYLTGIDGNALFGIAKELSLKKKDSLIMLGSENNLVIISGNECKGDAKAELEKILKKCQGNGGGNSKIARALIKDAACLEKSLS
ncbi:MAG: alanine--tRNA ligase [Candidatus Diapherotrites archaeon CG08_land_8_20_14_0_20_34_12]|nr:MAG: alanine--tRNA ligase [Candidatus Diapherotrites archaeon CG08_land_8_20_14_0_20_34_12]